MGLNHKTLVYLDQNIFSDLRDRKLFTKDIELFKTKNRYLIELKSILMRNDFEVIYSHVTLDEIFQIKKDENYEKHCIEHYAVLEQLDAKYINPLDKNIIDGKPWTIALDYFNNKKVSINTPYYHLERILDDFNRKITGLHINDSIEEIGKNLIETVEGIVNDAINQLNALNTDSIEEPMKSIIINMKKTIPNLLKNSLSTSNPFSNVENLPLGIKAYREHELTREFMSSNPSRSEIVVELKNRWKKENHITGISSLNNNLIESKIFYAYTQLNWVGYYSDDLTKVRKGKSKFNDRFNASQNDMKHTSNAYVADYFISDDKKLREKTILCYKFANIKTVVCSSKEFLKCFNLMN